MRKDARRNMRLVFDAIRARIEQGEQPTRLELAADTGLCVGAVQRYVPRLWALGAIDYYPAEARGIAIALREPGS